MLLRNHGKQHTLRVCLELHYFALVHVRLGWSKEELLQAWLQNPEQVCEEVGVDIQPDGEQLGSVDQSDPPANGGMQGPVGKQAGTVPTDSEGESKVKECGICCSYDKHEVQIPCGHYFCSDCWKQ